MVHSVIQRCVLVAMLLGIFATCVGAQQGHSPDYGSMTAAELLAEVDRLDALGGVPASEADAIAHRAAQLFPLADPNEEGKNATWQRLASLIEWHGALTTEESQQLAGSIAATPFDAANSTYHQLRYHVILSELAGGSKDTSRELVTAWLTARDITQLKDYEASWCLNKCLPNKTDRKAFSVSWTGMLVPPQAGQFIFSVSPINVSKGVGAELVRQSIQVSINGQIVVNALPDNWQWRGEPIDLPAGKPVPIRVDYSYEISQPTYSDSPSALLYFEGPGTARQIVPNSVLTPPDGQGNGLRAEYRWHEAGQPQQRVLRDPNIDFAWGTCRNVAPDNPDLVAALTSRIWQLCTAPEYLAACTAATNAAPKTHLYFQTYTYASCEYLTSAQRQQFLKLLIQSPDLLKRANQAQLVRLYRQLRFGAEDEALDMLGSWMQLHADLEPRLAADFYQQNRYEFRHLTLYLVWQHPDQFRTLHDRYLETSDGRCCLPVAYTLAYSYLVQGKIEQWIAELDGRLANPACSGDSRVNWLLARAMAEEIRYLLADRHDPSKPRLGDGDAWINEAAMVVENPSTKTRVLRERVTRLAANQQWDAAKLELKTAPAEIASWNVQIDALQSRAEQAEQQQAAAAESAYRAELARRQAAASNSQSSSAN